MIDRETDSVRLARHDERLKTLEAGFTSLNNKLWAIIASVLFAIIMAILRMLGV